MGRTSLQKLHQILDRKISWKIDKCVDVIGVHVVNLHMEALVVGVLSQVTGHSCRGFFRQHLFAIQGSPNQMKAATRIKVEGHDPERKPLKRLVSIVTQEHRPEGRC